MHDESASVYNLTVADLHTFYPVAGATPVLTHSAGEGTCVEYANFYGTKDKGMMAPLKDGVLEMVVERTDDVSGTTYVQ